MTPQQHAQRISRMLQEAQQECRSDIGRVDDPKAQALFETIAEVLGGTMRALEHYANASEAVWQTQQGQAASAQDRLQQDVTRLADRNLPEHQRPAPEVPQPPVVTDMATDISEKGPPPKLHTE